MVRKPERFADLLTYAVRRIAVEQGKSIAIVQDELGYALGKKGAGSAIEHWRKGNVPAFADAQRLACECVRRGKLPRTWLEEYLDSADYDTPTLFSELFPDEAAQVRHTPSPFTVGPPTLHPRNFFGRTEEVAEIFGLWQQPPLQHAAIYGPPRSGKTSLLHYLRTITTTDPSQLRPAQPHAWLPDNAPRRWVYVDFHDPRAGCLPRLLAYLLKSLGLPVAAPCDLASFTDIVSEQLTDPAIILMDEVEIALAAPELTDEWWNSLRFLATSGTDGRLGFVIASKHAPDALLYQAMMQGKFSSFFQIFGYPFALAPLTEEEARTLLAQSPVPFPEEDILWILKQSHHWPAILQVMGDTRLKTLNDPAPSWRQEALNRLIPFQHLLAISHGGC